MILGSKGAYPFEAGAKRWRAASMAELLYAVKDIREVIRVWPDHPNGGWYADELHTVGAEINRRKNPR